MQMSKLSLVKWAWGIRLLSRDIEGVPSALLRRELGIGRKGAWMLIRKIREGFGVREAGPPPGEQRARGPKRTQRLEGRGRPLEFPFDDYGLNATPEQIASAIFLNAKRPARAEARPTARTQPVLPPAEIGGKRAGIPPESVWWDDVKRRTG